MDSTDEDATGPLPAVREDRRPGSAPAGQVGGSAPVAAVRRQAPVGGPSRALPAAPTPPLRPATRPVSLSAFGEPGDPRQPRGTAGQGGSLGPGSPAGPAGRPLATRGRRTRQSLRRLDPWSVFLTTLLLSVFLGIMTLVAAYVLYGVLVSLGVPASINKLVDTVKAGPPVLTQSRFMGVAALLAAANVVLLSVLATLGAVLYNLVSTFTGGIDLTVTERD